MEKHAMYSAKRTALHSYEHFAWRSLVGLAAVIAAATGFGLLLLLVRWNWPPLASFDRHAVDALNHVVAGRRAAVAVLTAITGFGGRAVLFWLVTVSAVTMLVRRQYQLTAYLVVTGLGALALDPAIKLLVGRLRPVVPAPVATAPGNSFPSGHALDATVFYGVMLLVFLPIIPRRLRRLIIGLVVALVVMIGVSRVALGVHYPSDVIGGWLLGVAWLGITTHAFGHWRAETGQPPLHLTEGLAPEAAPQLGPARIVPVAHPWLVAARLVVSFVLVTGALFGLGKLITSYMPAFDEAVPRWLAAHRTPQLNTISDYLSQAGNTHWILAIGLVIVPLALALIRRWRPAVFVAVVMLGELGLFLTVAATVHRPRPYGPTPTSANRTRPRRSPWPTPGTALGRPQPWSPTPSRSKTEGPASGRSRPRWPAPAGPRRCGCRPPSRIPAAARPGRLSRPTPRSSSLAAATAPSPPAPASSPVPTCP
jgi:undecaprenyl-diphosphatase